jgi:ornithine lipid hydroxylase
VSDAEPLDQPSAWFDWLTWPALVVSGLGATAALMPRMSATMVTVVVTAGLVVILLGLERLRPQRARAARGESVWAELGHVAVGLELGSIVGYGAAVALGEAVASGDHRGLATWPLAAQLVLGLLVVDLVGYVHHRLLHRVAALWPFHALHHQPRALDLLKTGRFHPLDLASFTFLAYVPLLALGPSVEALAWVATTSSIAGLLQHANVRMPTPTWLDAVVCTPAVHWRHHSRDHADDGDFATLCMLFDRAFGTWAPTRGQRPPRLGLDDDPLPPGWLASLLAPLRRARRR